MKDTFIKSQIPCKGLYKKDDTNDMIMRSLIGQFQATPTPGG